MTQRSNSANIEPIVSRNVAGRQIGDALRKFVGRGCDWTVKQLSNHSGVPDRVIECAMCDPETTDWRRLAPEHLLSLMATLGAEFASEVISLAALGAFKLPDDGDTPPGAIVADDAEDLAVLTNAARDGTFEDNKPELKVVSARMVTRGMTLARIAA